MYELESGGEQFIVYSTTVPYVINSSMSSTVLSIYLVAPASDFPTLGCGYGGSFEVYLLNVLNPALYNQTARQEMFSAYCRVQRLLP